MAQDFPNNPTLGQVFGSYVWNGTAWTGIGSANNLGVQVGGILAREAYDYHPNYVINGGFDIWQRGTSNNGDAPRYLADRWHIVRDSNAAGATYSRQAGVDNTLQYSMRVQRDSGSATSFPLYLRTALETADSMRMSGKTVTLSFYARKGANFSASADALSVRLYTGMGVDQSAATMTSWTSVATPINSTATLTASWARYSFTGLVSASATQVGILFTHNVSGTAGVADFFEIAGVQLEAGSVATAFRRNAPSIAAELAACQRYYQRFNTETAYGNIASGWHYNTTQGQIWVAAMVPMRIVPTAIDSSGSFQIQMTSGNQVAITGLSLNGDMTRNRLMVNTTTGATTANIAYMFRGNNDANAYIGFSAEL